MIDVDYEEERGCLRQMMLAGLCFRKKTKVSAIGHDVTRVNDDANDRITDMTTHVRPLGLKRKSSLKTHVAFNGDIKDSVATVETHMMTERPRRVSINTCIRTMREGSNNLDCQLLMIENVGNYADEETIKVVLAKSDAISCVIHAMNAFPEKEELQHQACASLLKMASISEVNCVYICNFDGIQALISTMRRYQDNLDITRQVLNVISYISATATATKDLLKYGCHSDVLATMSRHSDDRFIVRQCCFILGNLVISVETAQQLMLVGGVHTLIDMLKHYHDDRDILENGCRALGSFAIFEESCLDVAQAGATATVVDTMTSSHSDVSVKECCCWALACLTTVASTCKEFLSLRGLPALLDILEEFPEEEVLQDNGLRIICNIGALESTVHHVSTCRVTDLLLTLYENFPDNVELMENMMLALGQVAATEPQVQEYMLASEGLKYVIAVMKALEENPAIQESGCRILGNMAVNRPLRKPTEQLGASQAIVAAMLNIEYCPDVQLCGCMAVMNLTADSMDNKMRVKNNGGVTTLLATLRRFPFNPEVVLAALKTLGNLVDLEEACRQLLDDDGLSTIVEIAKDNKAENRIRAFAGLVLSGLTALPDLPLENLLKVEEVLVKLQAEIPRDPDVALSMCQGLHNLLKSEVGMETLTRTGWLIVVENTIRLFDDQPEIHLACCRIVASVAYESHARLKTRPEETCPLSEGSVRSVLQSMRQFPGEKELQLVGSGALSCVCQSFEHLRKFILQEGGLSDVINPMSSFPTDDRLNFVGLIALSYLLPLDVEGDQLDADHVVDVITSTMSHFMENEGIQISACQALEKCQVSSKDIEFQILTNVHSAVRRHSSKSPKVVQSAARVFKRFGGFVEGDELTEQMLESPTTPLSELLDKIMRK